MKLKIGETLILEQKDDQNQITRFRCKIAEVKESALLIDYPIDEKTGKTPIFINGMAFMATYIVDNQAFRFQTTFVHRIAGQIPLMLMSFDGEENMVEIQRRNFVRVEANVDIAIHSLNEAFHPFTTLTSDVGGGGILILLPDHAEVSEEDMVESWISLPMTTGSYQYIRIRGIVVRIFMDRLTSSKRASIQFLPQTERERQPIIRFCFEKQLEARKKLLDLESRRQHDSSRL
ncbi:flagellar brake protein [Sporolactobacillus laevolacticus]|uniref:Pilus assembly protein PilZ n=1 Tax=Sporolactobacillus laevolacticus DSM 442 TaxID=1395513 RepID=V6IWR3_9BACL|nr:flagellar brake domain-containing protein [Sporolactobacillus laevolacticus]EST11707.1 pilus assembly protein PilZ [Sporolactobacillus laevolacticus DSM 442]MDN3953635.1 flagellar brake domain-containing protein [Sporolactobacillus laevolacticus]